MTLFIAFNSLSWRKSLWNLSKLQVADCFLLLSHVHRLGWLPQSGLAGVRWLDNLQEHLGTWTLTCVETA